jgi:hypothetical protein
MKSFSVIIGLRALAIVIFLFLISCRPTDITGFYQLKKLPKTYIRLKSDSTFGFALIRPNPYLHPFDHPEQDYFVTRGNWTLKNNTLIMNSFAERDSVIAPTVISNIRYDSIPGALRSCRMPPDSVSLFAFRDIYDDPVKILYGKFPDGTRQSMLHRSMEEFTWSPEQSDTVEFHFFGYKPYTFIRPDKEKRMVNIRLYPGIKGGVFKDQRFKLNKNVIRNKKVIFRKATR